MIKVLNDEFWDRHVLPAFIGVHILLPILRLIGVENILSFVTVYTANSSKCEIQWARYFNALLYNLKIFQLMHKTQFSKGDRVSSFILRFLTSDMFCYHPDKIDMIWSFYLNLTHLHDALVHTKQNYKKSFTPAVVGKLVRGFWWQVHRPQFENW